jgi:Prolyl oligopeptidase family
MQPQSRPTHVPKSYRVAVLALALLVPDHGSLAQSRVFQPEDLFRAEYVNAIRWTPRRDRAVVEIGHTRWLDRGMPTNEIAVVDVGNGRLRRISPTGNQYLGFFGANWSPDGERLGFLSVDTNAVVRPWVWKATSSVELLGGLQLHDALADAPRLGWSDDDHLVMLVRDTTAPNDGPLYERITRDRNVADEWRRAREAKAPSVLVVATPGLAESRSASFISRVVSVDVRTHDVKTLATGPLHQVSVSRDRRTVTYFRENPPVAALPASDLFVPGLDVDDAYLTIDWGSETHRIDARTGAEVTVKDTGRVVAGDTLTANVRLTTDKSGTRLTLSRRGKADTTIWSGNQWLREIRTGRAERIDYASTAGAPLTGWLLYPSTTRTGQRIPLVTVVYPGQTYNDALPSQLDLLDGNFEHPQLFAALGYGVVLASMPKSEKEAGATELAELTSGVLPILDTLIARGVADSTRIAVLGQSGGGYATLGLITQTNRFRSAIASGAYANLTSLYGTFYGQYRHGDAGAPQRAQLLRMLQMERGFMGGGAPPWEKPELYAARSPLTHVAAVRTPVMLIKGDADFIPLQQAEEFFTALYRLDQRAMLVRYAGEEHTISARENVLDLWRRMAAWLSETMPTAASR